MQTTWDEAVAAKRYEMKSQEPLFEVDEEDLSESDGIYRTDSEVEDTEEELYLDSIDQVAQHCRITAIYFYQNIASDVMKAKYFTKNVK